MNDLLKRTYDKVAFALALIAAATSASWLWRERVVIRSLSREPIRSVVTGSAYVAGKISPPGTGVATWSNPPVQSRGSGWLYDVFTPPAISYNPVGRTFAVTPLHPAAKAVAARPALQLLAVKRQPYRLQLVGYFGGPGDYVAAFASELSPETLLARPGHRFDRLGLTLKSFDVQKVAVEGGELGPAYEVAAVAVLRDETADAEVVLDGRTRKLTDTLLAVLEPSAETGGPRELHEGDTVDGDDTTYRVERIRLDPPEVIMIRTSAGLPGTEKCVLRPVESMGRKESPPQPFIPQATTDVAAANP